MKHLIPFLLTLLVIASQAQNHLPAPGHLLDKSGRMETYQVSQDYSMNESYPLKSSALVSATEEGIGDTRYDNQSNASIPKKIFLYDDGTIAATWTRSMDEGSFFADRGTGYNYFNGQEWGEWPESRVEDIKIHRPVYAPWGENGEMIISHTSGSGLYMATRPEKGSGDWDFSTISGPPDEDYILWVRAVTSGADNSRVHLLSLTLPESHGGVPYQGLNGALLYSLSLDGGETWQIENEILDGMTSDDYYGFKGDTYAFAQPVGDVVAFVVGEPLNGLFLMKSTDGGLTFEKTTIWENPYPGLEPYVATDTFYCADGSHSLAIDDDGVVHVAFGITRIYGIEGELPYQYYWVDGIAYWNEEMPAFSDNLNALSPYNHPDSELEEDYNLVAWSQDINNNGQLDFLDDLGRYDIGLSSMPQLVIDGDNIYLVYSSVTETYSNGLKNYRHLWGRAGAFTDDGTYWFPNFNHLTSDVVHVFDECVYPAVAANSDEYVHLIYQRDGEPGTATWYSQHDYVDNEITYLKELKFAIVGVGHQMDQVNPLQVSQNFPNPFLNYTQVIVEKNSPGALGIKLFTPSGQLVWEETKQHAATGKHIFEIDGKALGTGIYFYTVTDGETVVTKKMIKE